MRSLPEPTITRFRSGAARLALGAFGLLALGVAAMPDVRAEARPSAAEDRSAHIASSARDPLADAAAPDASGDGAEGDGVAGIGNSLAPDRFERSRYLPLQLQFLDRLADGQLQWQARLLGAERHAASIDNDGTPFSFVAPGDHIGAALRVQYSGLQAQTLALGLEAQRSTAAGPLQSGAVATRYSAYVQDEWRWSGGLSGQAGVRVNRGSATQAQGSPYAALTWQVQPATALKARYARSSPASPAAQDGYLERLARLGNPAVDGEGIDMLEATLDRRLGGEWLVSAVAYRWSVGDAPAATDAALDDAAAVPGRTVAQGLELSTDRRWSWGSSRLRGSVAVQRVVDADGGLTANAPAWLGKLDFSTRLPLAGLQLGWVLRYDVAQRGSEGADRGAGAVTNLRLHSDQLASGLDIGVSVHNVLDNRDALPVSYGPDPAGPSGRTLRLDAVYRF